MTKLDYKESSSSCDTEQPTILIVDDSPTDIHVLKGHLEQENYNVITAKNGEDGIEMALQIKPHLILMDVVMPGMNGFKATRYLSNNPETMGIPIIMVTTKDQDTDRTWALRQGATDYVVKPVVSGMLLEKIHILLSRVEDK